MNILRHKKSIITIDVDNETKKFLLENKSSYKTINIILNETSEQNYSNIIYLIKKLNKKFVITSLSLLTERTAKSIATQFKDKVLLNRCNEFILSQTNKTIVFTDDIKGVKMEEKTNKTISKIIKREPLIKFKKPSFDFDDFEIQEKINKARKNKTLSIHYDNLNKKIDVYCNYHKHHHICSANTPIIGCPYCGVYKPSEKFEIIANDISTFLSNEIFYEGDADLMEYFNDTCKVMFNSLLDEFLNQYAQNIFKGEF